MQNAAILELSQQRAVESQTVIFLRVAEPSLDLTNIKLGSFRHLGVRSIDST